MFVRFYCSVASHTFKLLGAHTHLVHLFIQRGGNNLYYSRMLLEQPIPMICRFDGQKFGATMDYVITSIPTTEGRAETRSKSG